MYQAWVVHSHNTSVVSSPLDSSRQNRLWDLQKQISGGSPRDIRLQQARGDIRGLGGQLDDNGQLADRIF